VVFSVFEAGQPPCLLVESLWEVDDISVSHTPGLNEHLLQSLLALPSRWLLLYWPEICLPGVFNHWFSFYFWSLA
jgi:hypothetical protein